MICPHCGRRVPDGIGVCPHCHASTEVTQKMSLDQMAWCPSCGALVPADAQACPKCGRSLREPSARRGVRRLDLPEIDRPEDEAESARTGVMTRIESAIPPVDDETSPGAARDRMPRPRAFAFAALFAVAVVGGAALLITHPWDPTATQTKATSPADTSMSGFPGVVESLSGQDVPEQVEESPDPEEALRGLHTRLGELADQVDDSESTLRAVCALTEETSPDDGLASASSLSIEVSNLISEIEQASDLDGELADAKQDLLTLGNWLRNRCDALTDAWGLLADADDVASASDGAVAAVDASSDYRDLFEEGYGAWSPEAS